MILRSYLHNRSTQDPTYASSRKGNALRDECLLRASSGGEAGFRSVTSERKS